MIITIDEEFPDEITSDSSLEPQDRSQVGVTCGEECVRVVKDFIREHRKPNLVTIDWNERKQNIFDNTPFPQSLIDLIGSYEIGTTQKDFLNLKHWFQLYDHSNTFINTTRYLLILNFFISNLIELVLTGRLEAAPNKTQSQTELYVLSWFNICLMFIGFTMSLLYTGAATSCDKPDFEDRFRLLRNLRELLSLDPKRVTKQHLNKSRSTTETLLQRSTNPDSRLFLFTLLAITPFSSLICLLGFNCYPNNQGVERALLGANTVSVGLAAFGLYKNRHKNKLAEQQQNVLTSNQMVSIHLQ